MNTYVKTTTGYAAIRASRFEVKKLKQVVNGEWAIVPATARLRKEARLNVDVKTCRILQDGRVGLL